MAGSVQVEALLHSRRQEALSHDLLRGIFRKLQVVDAGVDRRVTVVCGVHLEDGDRIRTGLEED